MNRSFFGNAAFMGNPMNQVPLTVEFHDELDINHVMGCKKCKRKKRRPEDQFGLPTVPLIYPPSDLI